MRGYKNSESEKQKEGQDGLLPRSTSKYSTTRVNFPKCMEGTWGKIWFVAKEKFLSRKKKKYLIFCVGRLSPEK